MKALCSTCGGKGSIPDPQLMNMAIGYCGPNGERCPYVICQTCGGSGWIEKDQPLSKESKIIFP